MKNSIKFIIKLSTFGSVGFVGWYCGKYSEQKLHLNTEKDDSRTSIFHNIRKMPGLPLFGTVSAATTFVPAESGTEMGAKLSSTASRVSEVS